MRLGFLVAMLSIFFSWVSYGQSVERIKSRGALIVGLEPGFMPFEMQTSSGEMIGFDVEMMKAFAKHLGVKVKFVTTKWDGIIPGLMAKKYDLIVSGMTITEARRKAVNFSDPYYKAGLKVLMQPQLKDKVVKLEDLDRKQYTIAVKLGTTGDIFVSKTLKQANIRKLDSEADAAQSVLLGKVDAFIYDKPYLELKKSSKGNKVALLDGVLSEESFGAAARRQDKDLILEFNKFLKAWKADKVNGYDKVYKDIFVDMVWKKQFPNLF